jgi:hypothetical protein
MLAIRAVPRRARGPLSLPRFPPPRGTEPRTRCPLFPLCLRHRAAIRATADLDPLFSPFFFSIRSMHCHLPAPHRACLRRPPIASQPHHQKSEPPPASSLHLPGKLALRASWLASGVSLILSLPLRHCRTPPPVPPVTGMPPPTWDVTALPLLRPRTSRRCSGEPSPPQTRQARCCRPNGAHAAFSGTRCLPKHADQPHCPTTTRGDHAVGRLRGWTGPPGRVPVGWSAGRVWQAATPCTMDMVRFEAGTVRLFLIIFN